MNTIRKAIAFFSASLALLFPFASHAYTIDNLAGDWFCAARQTDGELSGEHTYTIRPDRSAVIIGKLRQDSDDIRIYIEYQVEHDIIVNDAYMTQIPIQVGIQTLLINDVPAPDQTKQDMQHSIMTAPFTPFAIRYLNKSEFFYSEAGIVTACGKETDNEPS